MPSVTGYNLFLIIVTVVAAVLIAAVTLYLLVAFAHPEDRMQAWVPKIVVCLSMFIAIITVLLFPLDVANRRACDDRVLFSDCDLTLPMRELWEAAYIINVVLVYLVTPFTLFYYEADSDLTLGQRIKSACLYTFLSAIVFVLVFAIVYGVGGYVEYDTTLLSSGTVPLANLQGLSSCISPINDGVDGAQDLCSALSDNVATAVWKERPTFLIFIVAVASILGWLLLMVMGGVGMIALPLDMILAYFGRPTKTITKTQYIDRAKSIAKRAHDLSSAAQELRRKELSGDKKRVLRKQSRALQKQLVALEDEEHELERMYPQGEDRDTSWVMYVLGFYVSLILGVIFAIVGLVWIIHIVVYILIDPPLHPFLNSFFSSLDDVFVLFGVAFFALFCFYLILAAIKGFTKLGLNFIFIQLYPMRLGATMMNAFLVNTALILLSSTAVVQFCAQAFEEYAQQTTIQEVFGTEIFALRGVRHLFINNIFIYVMLAFALLTALWLIIKGPQAHRKRKLSIEEIYAMG